jgi:hypothetical protein
MPGTYAPLEQYLSGLALVQEEDTLTFDQVEIILDHKLPPSAYQNYAWWANQNEESHFEEQAWVNAGWRVDAIDFQEKWVRFVRVKAV